MINYRSFFDEMLKLAGSPENSQRPATGVDVPPRQGPTTALGKLVKLQGSLAPLEGSNLPGRMRYLKLKEEGEVSPLEDSSTAEPYNPVQDVMPKQAGIAGDLRRSGLGGVKRPPFPTDDSTKPQQLNIKRQNNVARFKERTSDKMLRPDGPSVAQLAPTFGKRGTLGTMATHKSLQMT